MKKKTIKLKIIIDIFLESFISNDIRRFDRQSYALVTKACVAIGSFAGQQKKRRPKYQRIKTLSKPQTITNEPTIIPAIIPGASTQVEEQPLPPGAH